MIGDTSRSTSRSPSSKNHLYDFFCTSMRLGISRVSPILAKLMRSVLPSIVGLTIIEKITPFNKIDIRVFTTAAKRDIIDIRARFVDGKHKINTGKVSSKRISRDHYNKNLPVILYNKRPKSAHLLHKRDKNAHTLSNYNAVYYYSTHSPFCQEFPRIFCALFSYNFIYKTRQRKSEIALPR